MAWPDRMPIDFEQEPSGAWYAIYRDAKGNPVRMKLKATTEEEAWVEFGLAFKERQNTRKGAITLTKILPATLAVIAIVVGVVAALFWAF